jgi:predicted metal-dependent HD superfamily phosphohydrolase
MSHQELLKKISQHIVEYFLQHPDDRLFYHNLGHTVKIVELVNRISGHYKLDERDHFIVSAAAWFHDTGIIEGGLQMHETKSVEIAESFLRNEGVDQIEIEEVKRCILATKMPQRPNSMNENIICDADLYNLGTETFTENNKLVKKEAEAFNETKISAQAWRDNTIALMEGHSYHTDFCQSRLNKTKEEHLRYLKGKQSGNNDFRHLGNLHLVADKETELRHLDALDSKRFKHHLRGVETMFKNSSSNHQRLSVMADNKAFIMISVNSIIISVALGLIIGKFVVNHMLIVPTVLLLSVNVVTIIYAVLATRPQIMAGTFTKEQVEKKTVNLLFFGSFYKMPLKDFEYGIRQMMDDSEFLYSSLIKDIYWQGRVLGRKFRLLRISYDIFMYGTALAVMAYIISALLWS